MAACCIACGRNCGNSETTAAVYVELDESCPLDVDIICSNCWRHIRLKGFDINSGLSAGIVGLKLRWPFMFEICGLMVAQFWHIWRKFGFKGRPNHCTYEVAEKCAGYCNHFRNESGKELQLSAIILLVMQVLSETTNTIIKLCDVRIINLLFLLCF